jgi:hypothetical protein
MVRKFGTMSVGLAVAVFLLGTASPARASLILETFQQFSGTGLGAVTTVLTVQNTPSETGCVSFGGVIGASFSGGACTGSSADVKTGASQTQTRTLGEAGVTSASNFGLVFNGVEPAGDSVTVDSMTASFYNASGTLLYQTTGLLCQNSSGGAIVAGPCTLPTTGTGTGNSGYLIVLDPAQQLQATTAGAFANSSNVVGLSFSASSTAGGAETVFLTNTGGTTTAVPEPTSMALFGSGLIGLAVRLRRRRAA